MAYQTPKTDWNSSNVVQPADMNRIEQNEVELKKAATIDVADANGYFTSSPKNVENVLQELGSAVTTGKSKIATAITAMGQSAASTDTFDTLSSKIRAISTDATAGTGDVLSGKTFYQGGSKKTGTMPNNGAGGTITPGTSNIVKPAGYYSSAITVLGDANLIADNIVGGKTIFGVKGKHGAFTVTNGSNTLYNINNGFKIYAGSTYKNSVSFVVNFDGTCYLLVNPSNTGAGNSHIQVLVNSSVVYSTTASWNYVFSTSPFAVNYGDTITIQGYADGGINNVYSSVTIQGTITPMNTLAGSITTY